MTSLGESAESTAAPPSAHSFWPYFVVTGSLSMGYGSVFTLLAEFREKFGFAESELGIIAGAGFFAGFLAQVGLARFADRGHARLLVNLGIVVAIVSMLGMSVADQAWQFILARFFLGAGSGAVAPAVRRILITRDPPNMGRNLGTMAAYDVGGFVLGPLLAGMLAEYINLRAPFLFLAVLYGVMYLQTLRLDLSAGDGTRSQVPVRNLLRSRSILAGVLLGVAFYTTIGVFEASWSVLMDDLGASLTLISVSIALFAVPMIPLAPFGGKQAQRRGPLRVSIVSVLGAAACMMVYGYVELIWVLVAMSALHAVFDAFTLPAGQIAVAMSAPTGQAAAAQGLYGAVGLLVSGLAALVAGRVYEVWGPEALFTGAVGVMVVSLAGSVLLGKQLMSPMSVTQQG